jgi:hypothetical protein
MKHRSHTKPRPQDKSSAKPSAHMRHRHISVTVAALSAFAIVVFLILWAVPVPREPAGAAVSAHSPTSGEARWSVGMLRVNGLRIVPSGRSDASHVLNVDRFPQPEVKHAYWIATQIPALLNQLYCWCGCENRGEHRSNLQCFEDEMAVTCAVCLGTAEIAYALSEKGVTDAGTVQATVDQKWQPKG